MKIDWLNLAQAEALLTADHFKDLSDNGSLTARIRNACECNFQVQLIEHKVVYPHRQEGQLLNLSKADKTISRQVFLNCNGQAKIYAQTLIGLTPENKQLTDKITQLGAQSLGSLLFRDPLATRVQMHLATVDADHAFFSNVSLPEQCQHNAIWVRRSLYHYEGCELIVYEAFLYL